jgi:RimJ/RimL family protein N-acetyltransferase
MLHFQQIISDEQLTDPTIKARLLELQTEPLWRRNMYGAYCDRLITVPSGDYFAELFVAFNEHNEPVGILNPHYSRVNSLVEALCPAIFPYFRGDGHATTMVKWAFRRYRDQGFNRIEAKAFGYNKPSLKLCRKFFKEEHVFKEAVCVDGKFYDHHHFGILCRDIEL